MNKLLITALLATAASATAFAEPPMKPGLWEVRAVKQVMDGEDMAAQMAASQKQMQEMLASMPPAQRKQMEQSMGGQAMPSNNTQRICISAEMAANDKPVMPAESRCEPSKVQRSGNKTSFELNCADMKGKGESISSGDTITSKMDMVMTDARGRHTMQSETQMKYLGSDCKGIKPADQMAREMRGGQKR